MRTLQQEGQHTSAFTHPTINGVLCAQASSGAGAAAMEELWEQTRDVVNGKPAVPKIFPVQVRLKLCIASSTNKRTRAAVRTSVALSSLPLTAFLSSLPTAIHPLSQYAFNLFSHNSDMDVDSGYNEEELKMVKETAKIWDNKDVSGMERCCCCCCCFQCSQYLFVSAAELCVNVCQAGVMTSHLRS
eukprot:1157292-Pelagomonas_calceolata.AAC.2